MGVKTTIMGLIILKCYRRYLRMLFAPSAVTPRVTEAGCGPFDVGNELVYNGYREARREVAVESPQARQSSPP